jgi:mono/diheme cytochrome c family protein
MIKTQNDLRKKKKWQFINIIYKRIRMKKILIITGVVAAGLVMVSCNRDGNRGTGRAYMPDMFYSRAYETYAGLDTSKFTNKAAELGEGKIYYTSMPVGGTVARGDMPAYAYKNDSIGYAQSASVKSPLDSSMTINMKEAERLYLVNCGICHGTKLDGNGPLYKDGAGPYAAKPATLVGDAKYEAMPEGTMFHSVTYGKNAMGSYASQLSTRQRWEVIAYIKSKQGKKAATAPAAAVDSVAAPKK